MLIWNFPREGSFRNIWNVTHFIEKCWSKITGYDGKKPVYSPIGMFIHCLVIKVLLVM